VKARKTSPNPFRSSQLRPSPFGFSGIVRPIHSSGLLKLTFSSTTISSRIRANSVKSATSVKLTLAIDSMILRNGLGAFSCF
ncbi:hypothetical protein PENTCL1PPCAC_13156, partial [Pristionchus entomophagus]